MKSENVRMLKKYMGLTKLFQYYMYI